ncbi:zinc finger protein ush isoform X1 [Leptinotarsa decemlineata]|uniref:zinc finger protein ush isoform X1 n=1 Tax=Leptinotarsa decemlineata TaxID=7539 RepID=UPI003D304837
MLMGVDFCENRAGSYRNGYFVAKTRKYKILYHLGEVGDWSTDPADTSKSSPTPKKPSPDQFEDETEHSPKVESDEKTPRIRLKANLATDPALHSQLLSHLNVDQEQSPSEYLASLPSALQNALSRGFFLPNIIPAAEVSRPTESLEPKQPIVPIFQCPPCGIRFSSLSTLEAHQTYYCSHRINKPANDDESKSTGAEASGNHSDVDLSESTSKNIRVGKQYTCTQCSYSADKKVSLNRHMRMHTVSPSPSPSTTNLIPNGDSSSDNQDRYCAECDIRFSSQKTFRAHKMHYCNSRHMIKPSISTAKTTSNNSGSSPTSPAEATSCKTPPSPSTSAAPNQPFLALPTNPIIIVPYSLFRSASVLPGLSPAAGMPNPDTPCFLLPNGTLQPMTNALTSNHSSQQHEVVRNANKSKEPVVIRDTSSTPLDLSVRKSPELDDLVIDLGEEQEKENRKRSPSPEKIECVPSLHCSPPTTPVSHTNSSPSLSTSPKRKLDETSRSSSPKRLKSKSEKVRTSPEMNNLPPFDGSSLHPLLMRGSLPLFPPDVQMRLTEMPAIPPVMPQVLVKQGVSKCKDCNIVFCKLENYVIHKKHYCSARSQEEDSCKTSGSPPASPRSTGTTSPAGQYQQLICLACGIKFTSLDNLNAHQAYYCLKRGEMDSRKCGKCRGVIEPGHQCITSPSFAGWKCPCCEVISPTASAAQRHMDSHAGIKAYRCTICRYKGNTLRGMRTHIRMHFDKRSPDLQEEKYITYILEDEGTSTVEVNVIPSHGPASILDDRSRSPNTESFLEPSHHCNQCSYSSSYKANVLRHIKLVHESSHAEDSAVNGSEEKEIRSMPLLEEDEEILVKKEAIEPEVIIAHDEDHIIKEEVMEPSSTSKPEELEEVVQGTAKTGARYCKSCDIYFNYYSTFVAHKKFYCSSHAGEVTMMSTNNNNNNPTSRPSEEASVL